jgi:hypothetical protein
LSLNFLISTLSTNLCAWCLGSVKLLNISIHCFILWLFNHMKEGWKNPSLFLIYTQIIFKMAVILCRLVYLQKRSWEYENYYQWLYSPLLVLAHFYSFLILYTVRRSQLDAWSDRRKTSTCIQGNTNTNKRTRGSTHRVEFELTNTIFEGTKTINASDVIEYGEKAIKITPTLGKSRENLFLICLSRLLVRPMSICWNFVLGGKRRGGKGPSCNLEIEKAEEECMYVCMYVCMYA